MTLSTELVLVCGVGVFGVTSGIAAVRDRVNTSLGKTADVIQKATPDPAAVEVYLRVPPPQDRQPAAGLTTVSSSPYLFTPPAP